MFRALATWRVCVRVCVRVIIGSVSIDVVLQSALWTWNASNCVRPIKCKIFRIVCGSLIQFNREMLVLWHGLDPCVARVFCLVCLCTESREKKKALNIIIMHAFTSTDAMFLHAQYSKVHWVVSAHTAFKISKTKKKYIYKNTETATTIHTTMHAMPSIHIQAYNCYKVYIFHAWA